MDDPFHKKNHYFGFRISDDSYFREFDLPFVQISVWHRGEEDVDRIRDLARRVKESGKRYLIHPFGLYLSETRPEERKYYLSMLKEYARMADMGMILHDETVPGVGPLRAPWSDAYREALAELEEICPISLENGSDCPNVTTFWRQFARSLVFDIGHFRVAGMDCSKILREMGPELMERLDYVHLHRKGETRPGMSICDHWPLEPSCPELNILREILKLRPEAKVILEVDGREDLMKSLRVLRGEELIK